MSETRTAVVSSTTAPQGIIRKPIHLNDYTTQNSESKDLSEKKFKDDSINPNVEMLLKSQHFIQATQLASQVLKDFLRLETIKLSDALDNEVLYSAVLCSKSQDIELKTLYSKFRAKCKAAKILLRDVDSYVQQARKDLEQFKIESIKEQNQKMSGELWKDIPFDVRGIKYPEGYTPDWKKSVMLSGDGRVRFPFIPLIVESICPSDKDNSMEFKVATHTPDDGWKYVTDLRQVFWDYTKITSLSNSGLQVARHFAQELSKYLFDFYILNSTAIPTLNTVSQPGWYDEVFVYPGNHTGKYQLDHSSHQQLEKMYSTSKGSESEMLKAVKYIKSIDAANVVLGTLLSSPVVFPVGSDNIQVHIYGNKGGGKSTIVTTLLALFIKSNLKGAAPGPTATAAGRELFVAEHRDLPMVIEDLHQLKDIKEREQWTRFMMQFGNNDSKQRATKNLQAAYSNEYRGSLLTTSEYPVTSSNDGGGLQRRVVEIGAPRDMVSPHTAQWLKKIALNNYGLFGKRWIRCVQSHLDDMQLMYEEVFSGLLEKYPTKVPRHLQALSVIAVSNVFFDTEFLGMSLEVGREQEMSCIQRIVEELPSDVDISEHERAKPVIVDWIQRNFQKLGTSYTYRKKDAYDDPRSYDTIGVIKEDYIAINPGALEHMLQQEGFSVKPVTKNLAEDGFIVRGSSTEIKKMVRITSSNTTRMYVIPKHLVFGV